MSSEVQNKIICNGLQSKFFKCQQINDDCFRKELKDSQRGFDQVEKFNEKFVKDKDTYTLNCKYPQIIIKCCKNVLDQRCELIFDKHINVSDDDCCCCDIIKKICIETIKQYGKLGHDEPYTIFNGGRSLEFDSEIYPPIRKPRSLVESFINKDTINAVYTNTFNDRNSNRKFGKSKDKRLHRLSGSKEMFDNAQKKFKKKYFQSNENEDLSESEFRSQKRKKNGNKLNPEKRKGLVGSSENIDGFNDKNRSRKMGKSKDKTLHRLSSSKEMLDNTQKKKKKKYFQSDENEDPSESEFRSQKRKKNSNKLNPEKRKGLVGSSENIDGFNDKNRSRQIGKSKDKALHRLSSSKEMLDNTQKKKKKKSDQNRESSELNHDEFRPQKRKKGDNSLNPDTQGKNIDKSNRNIRGKGTSENYDQQDSILKRNNKDTNMDMNLELSRKKRSIKDGQQDVRYTDKEGNKFSGENRSRNQQRKELTSQYPGKASSRVRYGKGDENQKSRQRRNEFSRKNYNDDDTLSEFSSDSFIEHNMKRTRMDEVCISDILRARLEYRDFQRRGNFECECICVRDNRRDQNQICCPIDQTSICYPNLSKYCCDIIGIS